MKAYGMTDIGKKRVVNQDNIYVSTRPVGNLPNLFVVADGMGGHKAGDYASRYATDAVVESISANSETDIKKIITKAVEDANSLVFKKSAENEDFRGMGTTLVIAAISGDELTVANVGDSRLYLIEGSSIKQLTQDHSLVAEMVRMGQIDEQEARRRPDKNIITRAIGISEVIHADFFKSKVKSKEFVLLCSDGLSNMLEDSEMLSAVTGSEPLEKKTSMLIDLANQKGGKDNISVIIIEPENEVGA
ncbi:MAG: Stp1/IreP family PP2C-type Ser/Thr phosphatase [Lachnospiraceae bacterium]|nr:Stp1/IreP family PP2C-type Ser/Thr phosphatase [Lachnospiraceae bacterium]MBR4807964.1 Stp1/IreP family PP2C-type Ser/Thr phosphatase [Lachnospiraceae bacterium]